MRRVLLAAVLVLPAATGCVDPRDFADDLRNDLEAEDEFERRVLLAERVPFTPAGIADPQRTYDNTSDLSSQWNETVVVPERTRSVTVTFRIELTTLESPGPEPPVNPPDGEVRVFVEGPPGSDDDRNLTRAESATAGFDFTSPDPGEWTVGMEARGNGSVGFRVQATVPVNASVGR